MRGIKNTPTLASPSPTKPTVSTAPAANAVKSPTSSPTPSPTRSPARDPLAPAAGHWDNSQFGAPARPQSRAGTPSSSRSPSPQPGAAPSAPPTGSPRPASPSPTAGPITQPWGTPPRIQQHCAQVLQDNPGTKLTAYTAQGNVPGTNGGVCNAMTASWIKQGHQNPSASFGQSLPQAMPGLKQEQARFEGRTGALAQQGQQLKLETDNFIKDSTAHDQRVAAFKANKDTMSPAAKRQEWNAIKSESASLDQRAAQINVKQNQHGADVARVRQEEMAKIGGGLPHTVTANSVPIKNDFAHQLDAATQKPGFYALHLHSANGGPGHVVGMQVGKDGTTKFMDPNSGEFVMKDRKDMLNVATDHVSDLYMKQMNSFSVSHFAS